ncbi:MAG: M67 family metallopeptidase [Solirubrobacterales bacterium]
MVLPAEMIEEIVHHAREQAPNECCGIIATRDGAATKLYRATNSEASPFRFVIDSRDQLRVTSDIEDNGWELGAIYHSHTRSAAYPSQTDVNFAVAWPGVAWVIVSLEDPEEPSVKAFMIDDGEIRDAELVVE